MQMPNIIYLFLFLSTIIQKTKQDLPVHCLKQQILGKWVFQKGKILSINNDRDVVSCGHDIPDNPKTSYKAMNGSLDQVIQQFVLKINEDFTVTGEKGSGNWTLIYDEGWEIDYNGTKYTHFFKYYKDNNGKFQSDCQNTLVGWFNAYSQKEKGCSQAYKKQQETQNIQEYSQKNLSIVQPKYISQQAKINDSNENSIYKNQNKQFVSFSQVIKEDLLNHEEIVKRLNQIKGKTWKAVVPSSFAQFSLQKMNRHAGVKRHPEKANFRHQTSASFIQIKQKKQNEFSNFSLNDVSDLPKQFDWVQYAPRIVQQGACGSCYAISTANMLSARNRIKNQENIQFSAQHSLDCNYFNQGCEGGYGFLTSKFFSEFELVPESCHPYKAMNGSCDTCDVSQQEYIYKAVNYGYIGGAYGNCNERLMMEEIKQNGPIVVSFEPQMDFMYYGGGVYHSVDANEWIKNNEKLPQWEKVDHSVLCIGWGEDEEQGKYWVVQNSWGTGWGKNGYFKIRRGTDESNIESMGERAFVQKARREKGDVLVQQKSTQKGKM